MATDEDGGFPTDYEIAQDAEKEPITDVLDSWDVDGDDLELYGDYKAKLSHDAINRDRKSVV